MSPAKMETITVKALDSQQNVKFSWPAKLLAREDELIVLYGDWERSLHYAGSQNVPITNRSLEFYWLDRPYVISALFDRAWNLHEYYARVTLPPHYDEQAKTMSFVSLGVDLQIKADFDYEFIDHTKEQEAFEEERQSGLIELIELVERRERVFDLEFLTRYLKKARAKR